MSRLVNYVKETKGEMRHVSWPTRKQSTIFTIVVILVSLFVAAYLGFFDYIFSFLLELLIS